MKTPFIHIDDLELAAWDHNYWHKVAKEMNSEYRGSDWAAPSETIDLK